MEISNPLSHPRRSLGEYQPVEVAARLRQLGGLVFFDSALESSPASRISVVAARPVEVIRGNSDRDWERLREAMQKRAVSMSPDAPGAHGFAAGWVEYDGAFCFGIYEEALFYSHKENTWRELGSLSSELDHPSVKGGSVVPVEFRPELSADEFCGMVERAQEYIAAGDIYQVNLSHPFRGACSADPFAFYESLRCYSPAPYASFIELEGRAVLSSSPESFLQISGSVIRTRPIKGTRPRRSDPLADEKSAYDLITSPKEIAELVMITDLERNDLGRICEWGSVSVRELLTLERYEQVFHLVSTVEGRLRPEVDHIAALRACFPGGSITGAPKKRACEIIAELERFPRGLYTGAIGWLGFGGESQFNIAIRTVTIENGKAAFHVGAGIVADSIPAKEWQETLDKAAGILLAAERLGEG